MINTDFNREARKMGAHWDSVEKRWGPPELMQDEFDRLYSRYYDDMVAVEITLSDTDVTNEKLGRTNVITFYGFVIATAFGRDSGAKLSNGVAVVKGGFTSGGSMKNFYCKMVGEEAVLRMHLPRWLAEKTGAKMLRAATDKDKLRAERDRLLKRLAQIEKELEEAHQ